MKRIVLILLFFSAIGYAQDTLVPSLKSTNNFNLKQLASLDNFGTLYYTNRKHDFIKKTRDTSYYYTNVQLGMPSTVNAFNPLKINLFYEDFNTLLILDNRLAEVFKIDFNSIEDYKNAAFVTTGYDNTVWVFNQDTQQLELFNYKTQKTSVRTVPIPEQPLDLKSDYNSVWLLTKSHIYVYNYFGSLLAKIKNQGFESFYLDNGNAILRRHNSLFLLPKNSEEFRPLKLPELLIKQFSLTNETLYIYADEMLHQFHLKIN